MERTWTSRSSSPSVPDPLKLWPPVQPPATKSLAQGHSII